MVYCWARSFSLWNGLYNIKKIVKKLPTKCVLPTIKAYVCTLHVAHSIIFLKLFFFLFLKNDLVLPGLLNSFPIWCCLMLLNNFALKVANKVSVISLSFLFLGILIKRCRICTSSSILPLKPRNNVGVMWCLENTFV